MGVHIMVYKIEGIEEYEDLGEKDRYFIKSTPEWWDSCRCSGDKDFCLQIETITRPEGDDPANARYERYHRPANFDHAAAWVKENVFHGNQPRLLDMLDRLRADAALWLYYSW